MKDLAPHILRKRMLMEGFFNTEVQADTLVQYFQFITAKLGLKTYGDPIVHTTSGAGKEANQGYDAFVPLIDSGIYVAVWANQKFLSIVIYTCKDFDETIARDATRDFFSITEIEFKLF